MLYLREEASRSGGRVTDVRYLKLVNYNTRVTVDSKTLGAERERSANHSVDSSRIYGKYLSVFILLYVLLKFLINESPMDLDKLFARRSLFTATPRGIIKFSKLGCL